MKEGGRANALLVELLLVIFFFMISAAILAQVFADAKLKSRTAAATNSAMLEGQNIAEELYGTDDPEAVLTAYGFTGDGDVWSLEKKGYVLKVTPKIRETDSGILRNYEVAGFEGEKLLITLSSTRFIPKEVSP